MDYSQPIFLHFELAHSESKDTISAVRVFDFALKAAGNDEELLDGFRATMLEAWKRFGIPWIKKEWDFQRRYIINEGGSVIGTDTLVLRRQDRQDNNSDPTRTEGKSDDSAKPKKGFTVKDVEKEARKIRRSGITNWGSKVNQDEGWVSMVLDYYSHHKPEKLKDKVIEK